MSEPLIIRVKRLTETARLPTKAFGTDVGFDLFADRYCVLTRGATVVVPTGIAVEVVTPGWYAQIKDRSSLAAKGVAVGAGVLDPSYRGPVGVVMTSHARDYEHHVNRGDRIAQLILFPCPAAVAVEADELSPSERGSGGFGSTGV